MSVRFACDCCPRERTLASDTLRSFCCVDSTSRSHHHQAYAIHPSHSLKLPALPNITNIKHSLPRQTLPLQRLLQQPRRLQNILLRQHPRAPMNAHRAFTLRIDENIHRIIRIRMNRRHEMPRLIRSNGNHTEVERSTMFTGLFESGTAG